MKKYIMLLAIASLFGCAQSVIKPISEDGAADYGSAPKDAEKKIRAYLDKVLKDSGSIQVKGFSKPERSAVYAATEKPHAYDLYSDVNFEPEYGYRVCATYNAKNSYGGYTGMKTETYFFNKEGRLFPVTHMTKDMMSGMHQTGSFTADQRITDKPCEM